MPISDLGGPLTAIIDRARGGSIICAPTPLYGPPLKILDKVGHSCASCARPHVHQLPFTCRLQLWGQCPSGLIVPSSETSLFGRLRAAFFLKDPWTHEKTVNLRPISQGLAARPQEGQGMGDSDDLCAPMRLADAVAKALLKLAPGSTPCGMKSLSRRRMFGAFPGLSRCW